MRVSAATQLTLNFEPGLNERHAKLLDVIRSGAYTNRKPLKTIAADMDMSSSTLSRKLNSDPDDPRKFSVDDLECYINATGDVQPIYWLIEKYLQDEEQKQNRALRQLAERLPDVLALIAQASKSSREEV
ncbi:phage regulatory CII family protein [Robbsia andropogonis]|uniref:phage regulatory CII family protein n=1 Tax=Robbsia andropogonis TaxID=28092 RepID=UPI003D1DD13A